MVYQASDEEYYVPYILTITNRVQCFAQVVVELHGKKGMRLRTKRKSFNTTAATREKQNTYLPLITVGNEIVCRLTNLVMDKL